MKLTVKEYATSLNISVQSVYKKIKLGSIETVKESGITYVIVDSSEFKEVVKPVENQSCNQLFNLVKRRDKEIKRLNKEIKRLTKEVSKAQNGKSEVLEKFIFEVQRLNAPVTDQADEDVIEIKPKKKTKKDKKKKKK